MCGVTADLLIARARTQLMVGEKTTSIKCTEGNDCMLIQGKVCAADETQVLSDMSHKHHF